MLLLGNWEEHDMFNIGAFNLVEYRNVRLSSILEELRIGEVRKAKMRPVIRSAFNPQTKESPVIMLKMSHFTDDFERINWNIVLEDFEQQEQLEEMDVIDRSALLEVDDLLVNLRGQARVVRITKSMMAEMPDHLVQRGLRLAATNNFVLMRPNPQTADAGFLQMILDILLEDISQQWNSFQKEEPTNSLLNRYFSYKYTDLNVNTKQFILPIGVRELKELFLDIPASLDVQRAISDQYMKLIDKERQALSNRMSFRKHMRSYINPNIIP
jgi:hypothetical protein